MRKSRSSVDSDGASPRLSLIIRRTCALVRFGRSRFNVAASNRIWAGVTAPWARPLSFNASNPPARQSRIHRSMASLETVSWHRTAPDARSQRSRPETRAISRGPSTPNFLDPKVRRHRLCAVWGMVGGRETRARGGKN